MHDVLRELEKVKRLLFLEKQVEYAEYHDKLVHSPVKERRNEGITWYPVKIVNSFIGTGERMIVEAERIADRGKPHFFQPGKIVSVFMLSEKSGQTDHSARGIVNYIRDDMISVTLNHDELPEWIFQGKLGVNLMFDDVSYIQMEKALHEVIDAKNSRLAKIRDILLGGNARFSSDKPLYLNHFLNSVQEEALELAGRALDVAFIHGPPGTGKTTTIVEAIRQTLKAESQVLVCAPSNTAVDLLTERISSQGITVLRIGHPSRVTESSLDKTLDAGILKHSQYSDLKAMRIKIEEYKRLASAYKRKYGIEEVRQRKLLIYEAGRMRQEADLLEKYIIDQLVGKASVITCTLVGSASVHLKGRRFKTVFIDEASQALEPALWIPILKTERVIFAGDHHQLPPTIKSSEAANNGLNITLFEKGLQRNKADRMLTVQYRMNEQIMGFSNIMFYNGKLIAHKDVAHWKIAENDDPVEFIDTAGCSFFESRDGETGSIFNPGELNLLGIVLKKYFNDYEPWLKDAKIGIITPYRAQAEMLRAAAVKNNWNEHSDDIVINTVDSFQGQEKDVIFISLVRSNDKGDIGFLNDTRRMNVALTRAKKKLVIIGDSATIGRHNFYNQFLDYIMGISAYKSAYEYVL